MARKARNDSDLYYVKEEQVNKETIEELVKRKKAKEREQRIKEKNINQLNGEFDKETETVIEMTNKNKLKQDEAKRKRLEKQKQIKARKRKKIKFFLKFTLIIGLIIGGSVFAFTSPIFNVKNIEVVENTKVPNDTIISLSQIKLDQNIFKFNKNIVIKNIKENPYIDNIEIKRKLPNTVEIKVEERVAKYAVDYMGKYAYISTQGYILEIVEDNQKLPIIQGATTKEEEIQPGKRLNNEDLTRLGDVIKIMSAMSDNQLEGKVTSIDISNKNEYSIYLGEEKKTIHVGEATNLSNKLLYVRAIIEDEKSKEGDIFVNGDINNGFNPYFRDKV